jgi:hypothetical protein
MNDGCRESLPLTSGADLRFDTPVSLIDPFLHSFVKDSGPDTIAADKFGRYSAKTISGALKHFPKLQKSDLLPGKEWHWHIATEKQLAEYREMPAKYREFLTQEIQFSTGLQKTFRLRIQRAAVSLRSPI